LLIIERNRYVFLIALAEHTHAYIHGHCVTREELPRRVLIHWRMTMTTATMTGQDDDGSTSSTPRVSTRHMMTVSKVGGSD